MVEQSTDADATAHAVGWVAIEAARVEYMAAVLEGALIGTERAVPVVHGQNWASIKHGLEALIADRLGDAAQTAEGVEVDVPFWDLMLGTVRRADRLMTSRSDVVHALWSVPDHEGVRDAMTLKRWGRQRPGRWTLAQLKQLKDDLGEVAHALAEAVFDSADRDYSGG